MKSPFTGGNVILKQEDSELVFRKGLCLTSKFVQTRMSDANNENNEQSVYFLNAFFANK